MGLMNSAEYVNTAIARLALDGIAGFPFERFANDFFSALVGAQFVPLGGTQDGGADALEEPVWEGVSQVGTFYQASIEKDIASKARRTVARLRQVGRAPARVYMISPHHIRMPDRLEETLGKGLDCAVIIRDGNYIASHLNDTPETRATFWQHLYPLTEDLRDVMKPAVKPPSAYSDKSLVYTFLAQEATRRSAVDSVPAAMVDALILWALEGTDPDKGILRTADEISSRIAVEVPGVRDLAFALLHDRLNSMSRKSYPGGRAINWHRSEKAYCLPHSTRIRLENDKLEDESLRVAFRESVEQRCEESGVPRNDLDLVVEIAMGVLRRIYEKEGLEFSAFIAGRSHDHEYSTVSHLIREEMSERHLRIAQKERLGPSVLEIMRRVLYASNATERAYIERISKTYALLFSLASHPHIADYLNDVARNFHLYVGSDVIIRALSENLLTPENQVTRAALESARVAGATLVLTEPVLEEVLGHLRACDLEYRNHFTTSDKLPFELARQAPHIMLRAYLYARLDGRSESPVSWQGFVHRLLEYDDLHKRLAMESLASYLRNSFGFTYESRQDLISVAEEDAVYSLAMDLGASKSDQRLADNDALLCMAVYGRRHAKNESMDGSEFGLGTWWLTWETSILKYTGNLVAELGARYMLRPEFLLRFVALTADRRKTEATQGSVFSSVLGFTLGRRVSSSAFHKLMEQFNEAEQLEPARRAAGMRRLVDKLKSDMSREYSVTMDRLDRGELEAEVSFGDDDKAGKHASGI